MIVKETEAGSSNASNAFAEDFQCVRYCLKCTNEMHWLSSAEMHAIASD